MELKDYLELRDVCGEHIVISNSIDNIDFRKVIALNETATFLWNTAKNQKNFTCESLAVELEKEYDCSYEMALSDVKEIIDNWRKEGLLA